MAKKVKTTNHHLQDEHEQAILELIQRLNRIDDNQLIIVKEIATVKEFFKHLGAYIESGPTPGELHMEIHSIKGQLEDIRNQLKHPGGNKNA